MSSIRDVARGIRGRGRSALWMAWFAVLNRISRRPAVAPTGPVVSLTTFGARSERVHLAMESIARGRTLPSRLILWIDDDDTAATPPPPLRRLIARGAEVKLCEDLGPHKKYFPFVRSEPLDDALVTADDDIMYPSRWLAELVAVHRREPEVVVAHVTRTIELDGDRIAPYRTWRYSRPGVRSCRTFSVGLGGVLYPPGALQALRAVGDGFRVRAPRADDVWLHRTAVLGTGRIVVRPDTVDLFSLVPIYGGGDGGLMRTNVVGGGNDAQIAQTYDARDIARLRAEGDRT